MPLRYSHNYFLRCFGPLLGQSRPKMAKKLPICGWCPKPTPLILQLKPTMRQGHPFESKALDLRLVLDPSIMVINKMDW